MAFHEEHLTSSDGLSLRAGHWAPSGAAKAVLTLCHGQSEHIGRYDHLAERLNAAGYAFYMAEFRGHGKSDGQRGHITTVDSYAADFAAALSASRQHYPEAAHFLGGHSMGGLVAAYHTLDIKQDDYAGLVLSSAWIDTAAEIPPARAFIARVASKLAPSFSQDTGLDAKLLTHDQGVVAAYEADPLVHGKITAGAFAAIMRAQAETLDAAHRLNLPLYVIHGSADGITSPEATQTLYQKASSTEKTYKLYDGLYHELFNELEREAIIDDLITWLDTHTPPKETTPNV